MVASLKSPEHVYFDCGDCIKTGNLGVPLRREEAWELLAAAGCDAGTLGNRETHVLESAFRAKLDGAQHPLLVANVRRKDGKPFLPGSTVIERAGLRIGVLGVMVPMVTERMKTKAASAFLWDPPIPAAQTAARELRSEVDLVIALTHIGYSLDRELAQQVPEVDLVLGGHSHTLIEWPERIGNVWVAQTGSHGRFVGEYVWEIGRGIAEAHLRPLPRIRLQRGGRNGA